MPERNFGLQLHHAGGQPGIVQLVGYGRTGGSVASMDLATQEFVLHEGRRPAVTPNGLLVTREDTGLRLAGADGEIEVRHADQLASTDPLIVHGVGGILRLDRTLIGDPDTP